MKKNKFVCPFMVIILLGIFSSYSVDAQLLQRQFTANDGQIFTTNTSNAVAVSSTATYFNNTNPSNAQFNYAAVTSGTSQTLTSNGSVLYWTKTGTSTTGAIFRTTNLAPTAPSSLIVKVDFSATSVTTGASPSMTFYVGSGFTSYVNATTAPTVPATPAAKFGINTTSASGGSWGSSSNTTVAVGATKTITWVLNSSGATLSYLGSDGNNYTVATNTYDLWIGSTRDQTGVAFTTTGIALQNFAVALTGGAATFTLNNILIDPIPTAPAITSPTSISGTGFTANWGAVTGATGYYLDVSSSSSFVSFVSGYNNLRPLQNPQSTLIPSFHLVIWLIL